MSKITEIDNEYVTLWYYPDQKIVHHQYHKYISGAPLRDVLMKGLEIFIKTGAKKWLSDDRKNNAMTQEDQDFSNKEWTPNVIKAGWKYWALVMPDKVAGQLNMKRLIDAFAKLGVTVQIVESPEEGLEWLDSVD